MIDDMKKQLDEWFKTQPPSVEVAALAFGGAAQGGVLGAVMSQVTQMSEQMAKNAPPGMPPPAPTPAMMQGGPWKLGRNFAVMTGVNAGISAALKKIRGVDDVPNAMAAALGGGFCFGLVANMGVPVPGPGGLLGEAVRTGVLFAVLQGGFYQVGQWFSGGKPEEDVLYSRTKGMLSTLGLEKYEKNFRKGNLNDSTLGLLNEESLKEMKIPPGPRLLIMDYCNRYAAYLRVTPSYALQQEQPLSLALPVQ
mmetsp:Transcript_6330/g.21197  ORF Transcript_6330/g.21197 Transcript_6330/m.21197 type:complete len:251 (-) Transcript_6330:350-1102(-)|eukprot:CAMPEP_0170134848 /NCGR_PEP_ID=MMETSP0033_2-20121228/2155_1 /TAXON_ID=195969 /ORGANISM="Dolichomastix tenuilepis, Strain CCMP3274" /LENGTH=250 /DNA_ID=CAMNT_0010370431 /DNA_START=50 /DNA_END=802 /DNA_ORIENTATION=+